MLTGIIVAVRLTIEVSSYYYIREPHLSDAMSVRPGKQSGWSAIASCAPHVRKRKKDVGREPPPLI